MNDRKGRYFCGSWTSFFVARLYLLCLIDQRCCYLLDFTVSLTRLTLANPKPSKMIKLAKTKDWLQKKNEKVGSFCLTSGFWIYLEVQFPLNPSESEGHFLSFLSCYNPIELGRDVPAARRPMLSHGCASPAGCNGCSHYEPLCCSTLPRKRKTDKWLASAFVCSLYSLIISVTCHYLHVLLCAPAPPHQTTSP